MLVQIREKKLLRNGTQDMKVNIGPHPNWVGPYQIAEKLMFWEDKYDKDFNSNDKVHNFGKWLAGGDDKSSLLNKFCEWVHSKKKRKIKVKLHKYDTWNADSTMAILILPLLKQLHATNHGSGVVDAEDVPYELQHTGYDDGQWDQQRLDFGDSEEYEKMSWNITHERWDWVLKEIIWAFEQLQPEYDWEEQYRSGEHDIVWNVTKTDADGKPLLYSMDKGPKDTFEIDMEGREKHQSRISNGLRLFGKYYQNLWD